GGAFTGCDKLTEVELPENLKEIGEGAFKGCTGLTNVNIPDGVTTIEKSTFEGCENLVEVNLPETVTEIGANAFAYTAISSVNLDGVTTIGEHAFAYCNNLTTIVLPADVRFVASNAFEGCENLTKCAYPSTVSNPFATEHAVVYNPQTDVYLASGWIVSRGEDIILYAPVSLEGAYVVDTNIAQIGDNAFYGCGKLTAVTIATGLDELTIGKDAFSANENLASLNVGRPVVGTPFAGTGINDLTIGNHITTVANGAYQGCASLTEVKLGTEITEIGESAFEGCSSLVNVVIPPFVTEIGANAFKGCSKLDEVVIGARVTKIGESAFTNSITDLKVTAEFVPEISANTFSSVSTLYV
ncbi:MAG: leucine-rich repeat domain-containing protein, partial [Muribaculaceae bacterium]|nr:leucine-rich repeat domain-containing protein [Muribaculaceae bacterium]